MLFTVFTMNLQAKILTALRRRQYNFFNINDEKETVASAVVFIAVRAICVSGGVPEVVKMPRLTGDVQQKP